MIRQISPKNSVEKMKKLTLALASDHRGFAHKEFLKNQTIFGDVHVTWLDVGAFTAERSDYPEYAIAACRAMLAGQAHGAVLLCGTGVGMAIVANRFDHIYAGLAWNVEIAKLNKEHDHANVLVIPSDYVTVKDVFEMTQAWLMAEMLGERHQKRIEMIDALGGVK
jgi:ribose 5-phosphate isomerase B